MLSPFDWSPFLVGYNFKLANFKILLIFGSRPLKRFLSLEQLCLREHFLKVKPQPESANGA